MSGPERGGHALVRLAHTAALEPAALNAVRSLTDDVFGSFFDAHDWEHALGGIHAIVWSGETAIAHGSVVQRRLIHGGRALRTGYVEAVAVRPEHRGRGYGDAVMEALETVIGGAYDLGALAATDEAKPFYARRGWQAWEGPTSALTPNGVMRADDDAIYVLMHDAVLDVTGELTCDWRDGDVW